jgi:pyruvate kinase
MDWRQDELEALIGELEGILASARDLESELAEDLQRLPSSTRASGHNLLSYLALRQRDRRQLQQRLSALGLSSLGRAEGHVVATLEAVLSVLRGLARRDSPSRGSQGVDLATARRIIEERATALLGAGIPGRVGDRAIRVMVTVPGDAAGNYALIRDLIAGGVSCLRINCGHDDKTVWTRIAEHVRRARAETGKDCRLLVDLAGPKLRTGTMEPGPRVVHWEPRRDALGDPVEPARVWLTPAERPELPPAPADAVLPLDAAWLAHLRPGATIEMRDVRGKDRKLLVRRAAGGSFWADSMQLTYVGHKTRLFTNGMGPAGTGRLETRPGAIPPAPQAIELAPGDLLALTADPSPGRPVARDPGTGRLLEEPRISCTLPEVFPFIQPGERVSFDDGKIGGVVAGVEPGTVRVRITTCPPTGKKLREDRGINLPDTSFSLPALTPGDLADLDVIVDLADLVGLSFCNRPEDVESLQRAIQARTSRKLGIVLKIETRRAFESLPRILLTALREEPLGIMIARGDLAVECGYERLAEVQEEILWLCEAAHLPVIWATQVLESMNKKGVPTRAEVTDAAMGERAECVMLNKGPHVLEAVGILCDILGRMQEHQDKKSSLLRALGVSQGIHSQGAGQ